MGKILKLFFLIIFVLVALSVYFLYIAKAPQQNTMVWGVNFSQMQAQSLGLDWKTAYTDIFSDLQVKNVKLVTNWDFIEGLEGTYKFDDTDWQIQQAASYNAHIIYVVGMKTGRWPECHVPTWANGLSKETQQQAILNYITKTVVRYKDQTSVIAWQAENEPLFNFGNCPWYDENFLKKEVALIKSLDSSRPVIISDSGEQSFWFDPAKIGDIVGITMYRKVWYHITNTLGVYYNYPLPPTVYWRKAQLIKTLFHKEVISTELQAEPWVNTNFLATPLQEQAKTMSPEQFKKNIWYAKSTGLKEFYLWGVEWWYWMKEKQNHPEFWDLARTLFTTGNVN